MRRRGETRRKRTIFSRRARPRFTRLCGERLEERALLTLTPQLVADINATPSTLPLSIFSPGPMAEAGGVAYLSASGDVGRPYQLWKADGTGSSAVLVKNAFATSFQSQITNLTNVD